MNTELSNKIEFEFNTQPELIDESDEGNRMIECSICDTTINANNHNIYFVNKTTGNEFEEDTLCESCWYANKRQYKADGWGGDDLESSCDESANDSDDEDSESEESEDDAEERDTRDVDEDELGNTNICEVCEKEDVWTNYCFMNHKCFECVKRSPPETQNRDRLKEDVCRCPFCYGFGIWCDKCGHKHNYKNSLIDFKSKKREWCWINGCNGKLFCVDVEFEVEDDGILLK